MAKLSYAARQRLPSKAFALPKKDGYPIHDLSHARNALARVSAHGTPAEQAAVRAKVYAKYPGLKERARERQQGRARKSASPASGPCTQHPM